MTFGMRWRGLSCPSCGCGQETGDVYCECNALGQSVTWPDYFPFSVEEIVSGFESDFVWENAETEPGTVPSCPPAPVNRISVSEVTHQSWSGVLSKWQGSTTQDPLGINGPPITIADNSCWWFGGVGGNNNFTRYTMWGRRTISDVSPCWNWHHIEGGLSAAETQSYFQGLSRVWYNANTGILVLIPKEVWYPQFCTYFSSDVVPDPADGSTTSGLNIGWKSDVVDTDMTGAYASLQLYKESCDDAQAPCQFFMKDHSVDCDDTTDGGYFLEPKGSFRANIEPTPLRTCGCYFNGNGEGCNPFGSIENPNPISDLVLQTYGTTYTQNGASSWDSGEIKVPCQPNINFSDHIILSPYQGVSPGKFVRVEDIDYLLDSCTGTIVGTSQENALNSVTFTANNWVDCGEPTGLPPLVTGCCELQNGTTQNGVTSAQCAAVDGTFTPSSACPPVGCCTFPDTSVESNVTEAYCTTQGGSWASGACPEIPTGCCAIVGSPDQPDKTEAECIALGGTWTEGANCDGTGWCIDDTDGSVTPGVEENDCTGTWSATEPTMGCCDISGTQNPDVAQQWCTAQGGVFNSGDCVAPPFDPTTSSRIKVNDIIMVGPDGGSCGFDFTYFEYNFPSGPLTGSYTTATTKTCPMGGSVYGDDVFAGNSPATPVSAGTETSLVFGATTYQVQVDIIWTYSGTNYHLRGLSSALPISGLAGCPTSSLSGMLTSFVDVNNNYSQGCDGSDESDLTGSYNITLECQ